MRWLTYFILAYVTVGLQVGLGAYIGYRGAAPNLVLLAVIFIAINAPRDAALLGCFGLGVIQDLVTAQPPGLFALAYGLTAMFVISTHQLVYREHVLTHVSMAMVGGLITAAVLLLHGFLRPAGVKPAEVTIALPPLRPSIAAEFTRVLYTAALAPVILGLLQRLKRGFAFRPSRQKVRAWG